ncbi:MAG: 30S ribosomal protein S17 [Minisyncoccales bacterium]|jgi:small subunit ribosomal protein S17|nr:30S ribosomal protein S17 [Candidatus Pacearchaeota archaeon]
MKHQLTGKVVSDKMQKTVVVMTESLKEHPKYHKRYRVSKKYKAHDERNECKVGDLVLIEECRPLSADKKWKVAKKIAAVREEETAGASH